MSHQKQRFINSDLRSECSFQDPERAHLLEHVRFLEERTTDLETKVEVLRDMLTMVLELDHEEVEDSKEDGFFASIGSSLWDEEEEEDE